LRGSRKAPCLPPICGLLRRATRRSFPGSERYGREWVTVGNWLLYATGGGALDQLNTNATAAAGPIVAMDNRNETRGNWTLGGGLEVRLTQSWSAKIEYLYIDLRSRTTTLLSRPPITNASRINANVLDVGVNYHF
jgi:outer membrane immunogenic protein